MFILVLLVTLMMTQVFKMLRTYVTNELLPVAAPGCSQVTKVVRQVIRCKRQRSKRAWSF